VSDAGDHTIRKITPDGTVNTLAGSAGDFGNADGVGAAARFDQPTGIAVDIDGNVYVADFGNVSIRKVTATGVVTTLAGSGALGGADGIGTAASFFSLYGLAIDGKGNLWVPDRSNKIRKVTRAGVVSTFAGTGASGSADGPVAVATFKQLQDVAVDASGTLYVADTGNRKVRRVDRD